MTNKWQGKKVLITGVCGTVGAELLKQLSKQNCSHIVGIDNSETELFFLDQEFSDYENIELFLGDLRDKSSMDRIMRNVDIVLHSAALKHVILCERSPRDAVETNIQGMMNIIDAAEKNGVERLIFTSSDKAVNPTNVMGTTKLMGERLMTAANAHRCNSSDTIYTSTRFGNVLGSRGSVIPIFARQISSGGPITLTEKSMTRFIMTLDEAVSLVLESVWCACGGEIFVTKMPVIRISDLAEVMIEILAPKYGYQPSDITIEVTGSKPGEKMYEELLSEEEMRRTVELKKFFAIFPAFTGIYHDVKYDYGEIVSENVDNEYNSKNETPLTRKELREYFVEHKLLDSL
jgi:FlaA1/EpsC-like NDP-sugar epimerase